MRVVCIALLLVGSVASADPDHVRFHETPFGPQVGGASCTPSNLTYGNGPLIQQAKVVVVQWGGTSSYSSKLAGYYSAILQSPYMDWMREYDQGSYSIGRGSYLGSFVDPSPPSGTVDDTGTLQPLYLVEKEGSQARLVGQTGIQPGTPVSPELVDLRALGHQPWSLGEVVRTGVSRQIDDAAERLAGMTVGPYPEIPKIAFALPITQPGSETPYAMHRPRSSDGA